MCDSEKEKEKKQLPEEVQTYIDLKVAEGTKNGSIRNPGGYRATLEKKAFAGNLDMNDSQVNEPEIEKDPYRPENLRREAKLDKTTDAYYLTERLYKLNVERNPDYQFPEFLHDDIRYFKKLLETNDPSEVEAILLYHHSTDKRFSFIQDPFCFAKEYDQLRTEYKNQKWGAV